MIGVVIGSKTPERRIQRATSPLHQCSCPNTLSTKSKRSAAKTFPVPIEARVTQQPAPGSSGAGANLRKLELAPLEPRRPGALDRFASELRLVTQVRRNEL